MQTTRRGGTRRGRRARHSCRSRFRRIRWGARSGRCSAGRRPNRYFTQIVKLPSRKGTPLTESPTGTAPVSFVGIRIPTCQTPEIEPGAANADATDWFPSSRVIGRFRGVPGFGVIAPVTGAGEVTPSPFRKIVTTEPGAAGFVHVLGEPSGLKASGSDPPLYMLPVKGQIENGGGGPLTRKAAGLMATIGRASESERFSCVELNSMSACMAPAISKGAWKLICGGLT